MKLVPRMIAQKQSQNEDEAEVLLAVPETCLELGKVVGGHEGHAPETASTGTALPEKYGSSQESEAMGRSRLPEDYP